MEEKPVATEAEIERAFAPKVPAQMVHRAVKRRKAAKARGKARRSKLAAARALGQGLLQSNQNLRAENARLCRMLGIEPSK